MHIAYSIQELPRTQQEDVFRWLRAHEQTRIAGSREGVVAVKRTFDYKWRRIDDKKPTRTRVSEGC